MKILFQYYNGAGGALENIMVLLARLAKDNPCDEYVIVCNAASKLNQLSKIKNISIINPKEYFHKELTRLQLGLWGLNKLVNDLNPDIVWSMNLGSYVKLNALNLLSINNSHQVYPLKDTISHPKSRFHVFFMRFFFRLSLRKADRALTQTEVMKGYVKSLSPRKDVSVFTKVVESSSDIRAVEPPKGVLKKLSEISNTFSMLYVATNYHHKNHKVIIEALALLVKESKSVTLILSLTEEEAVNIGGEVASSLIRTQHLCCVGWVDKSWLKYLYDFTSICLMPSILESLSSAHLEAMAWQVPQISADLPFARETCKEASLYCEPDNASCWSKRITCLIESSILYRDLQIKGLARVEEFPKDWHEVAKKYHTMFVDELNKKV